jgi:hypothetical protein
LLLKLNNLQGGHGRHGKRSRNSLCMPWNGRGSGAAEEIFIKLIKWTRSGNNANAINAISIDARGAFLALRLRLCLRLGRWCAPSAVTVVNVTIALGNVEPRIN